MLPNTTSFSKIELQALFGSQFLNRVPNDFRSTGVSIDTRTLQPGNIFVALKGMKTDGHKLVADSFSKGASAAMVERKWFDSIEANVDRPLIIVENTQSALGSLGNYHRRRFDYPIVAVGGSNGKTTTKEMIASVLSQKLNVLKTHENFNNQLGVPLMLLQLSSQYNAAVLEIATNEPGEIHILSEMVAPTHGLITNIGKEHLEKLVDLDGVEMEETYLFGFLKKIYGVCFINSDDTRLRKYLRLLENIVTFGMRQEASVKASIDFDDKFRPIIRIAFGERELAASLNAYGYAPALCAIAAASVGFHFELTDEQIIEGLQSYTPLEGHGYGRSLLEKAGSVSIINDCYNANPSSMDLALETLKVFPATGRRIAVLADMLELGESSFEEHCSILDHAADISDKVLCTGTEMAGAARDLNLNKMITHFDSKDRLTAELIEFIEPGDTILVKASRGMKMEEVVDYIKKNIKK